MRLAQGLLFTWFIFNYVVMGGQWKTGNSGKTRGLAGKHRNQSARKKEELGMDKSISIGLLNCNGLNEQKLYELELIMKSQGVRMMCLVETKARVEDRKAIAVDGFLTLEQRRSDVQKHKPGGGLAILVRKEVGVVYHRHNPNINDPERQFVAQERMWVTYGSGGGKTAVCCTYLGFQANDGRHDAWNRGILEVLASEVRELRGQGFRIVLAGDFNSWVGCELESGGIPGNDSRINDNGRLFQGFLEANNLLHLNGACSDGDWSSRISEGLWTRHGSDKSTTVIDYVVISAEHISSAISLFVDEKGTLGGGSDHNALVAKLKDKFELRLKPQETKKKVGWRVTDDTDWGAYRAAVSSKIGEAKILRDVEGLADQIASIIVQSLNETVGAKRASAAPKKVFPMTIVKTLREKRLLEKVWKTAKCNFATSRGNVPPVSLLVAREELESKKDELREQMEVFFRQKRRPLLNLKRSAKKKDVSLFWRLVARNTKKSSEISALQRRRDQVLVHSKTEIAEEAQSFMHEIFQGEVGAQRHKEGGWRSQEESNDAEPQPSGGSDHQYGVNQCNRLQSEDSSRRAETDPRGFLDKDYSLSEVREVVGNLGTCKAAGFDHIPNEAIKQGPEELQNLMVILFNRVKASGCMPSAWRRGRLVLIHKRGPTTKIGNYRPLTVLTSMSSVYTKVLNARLVKVVEMHELLGEIQHGFRRTRSGADCSFVLNTVLWKASAKNKKVHLAFLDIAKAYDTVDRSILWRELKKMGFGGRFLREIQGLYDGDFVMSEINGVTTRPVYLGRGLRQGCSLSPLLFALYVTRMGFELTRADVGFKLNRVTVNGLLFADDIILIARTEEGLRELLCLVQRHFKELKLEMSVEKSKVMSSSQMMWDIQVDDEVAGCLEKVLAFKYLGVETRMSPFKGSVAMQKRAIATANRFRGSCLRVARDGPDTVDVALSLWENMALGAAFHGCESVPFSDSNILAVERHQLAVGKSALGIPVSSPSAAVTALLGLKEIKEVLYRSQLKFLVRVRQQDHKRWSHDAYLDHINGGWKSPFVANIYKIKKEIGMVRSPVSAKHVDIVVSHFFLDLLNKRISNLNLPGLRPVTKKRKFNHVMESDSSQVGVRRGWDLWIRTCVWAFVSACGAKRRGLSLAYHRLNWMLMNV